MKLSLEKCNFCPHKCGVNREKNIVGICKGNKNVKIARAAMHYFEEPCISGNNCGNCVKLYDENYIKPGSGTVFFSNCNLRCVFCQNYEISQNGFGKEISVQKLADIFLNLQQKGAYNINLVSPTIYVYQIKEALNIAKRERT